MTPTHLDDDAISTDEDFQSVLAEAVQQADQAGIDVRGAWEFETTGSVRNWEVEIVELHRDGGAST